MAKERAARDEREMVREAVGTFRSEEQLEAAVSELASAGWDRKAQEILRRHGA